MDKRRQQRVNQLMREEIADLLRTETEDPVLSSMISVTDVAITQDFEHAKVYVSFLEEGEAGEAIMKRLRHASRFFRRELADRLNFRRTPELIFVKDESIAQGARVLQLLREVAPPPEPAPADAAPAKE